MQRRWHACAERSVQGIGHPESRREAAGANVPSAPSSIATTANAVSGRDRW